MALKSTKSNQCFQITCVSESNLCTVTFAVPAYSVSCHVCMAFHMQEERKQFLRGSECNTLNSLGTSWKTVEIIFDHF